SAAHHCLYPLRRWLSIWLITAWRTGAVAQCQSLGAGGWRAPASAAGGYSGGTTGGGGSPAGGGCPVGSSATIRAHSATGAGPGMKLPARWQQRWQAWLDRRIPPAAQVTLSHRSIFILPTRSALTFGLLLLLLLITAINYQNSLIYALTFWLFSVGLAAMLFTFRNLSGLTLIAGHAAPCFAGERLRLPLWLQADRRGHQALLLGFPGQPAQPASVAAGERQALHLSLPAHQRGPLQTGRLRLDSRYPLGLFNAWSWVRLEFRGLVYPRPETVPLVFLRSEERRVGKQGRSARVAG